MAKKTKKVSIGSVDKVIKDNFSNIEILDWFGLDVEVKKTLSATEAFEFVNNCVNAVIDESEYLPEVKDFIIRSNVIEAYTNISLPDSFTHRYDILFESDIVEAVIQVLDQKQFCNIIEAIDNKIEYKKSMNISELGKRVSSLISAFENVYEQTESMYSGIEANDIKKLLSAVSNADFNEENVVKAYMNNTKEESDE